MVKKLLLLALSFVMSLAVVGCEKEEAAKMVEEIPMVETRAEVADMSEAEAVVIDTTTVVTSETEVEMEPQVESEVAQ